MQVVIDDKIVCLGDSDEIAFAAAHGSELWVILLEKMWAKIHSCYDRIAGGWEFETIRDLTGAPGYYLTSIEDDTFDLIQEYDNAKYIMGCSVKDGYDEDLAEKQGLVCGHAYTLLAVHEFMDKGKERRLVKLRNPWGSGEWNGSWSDNDKRWTDQLRKDVEFDGGKDDGIFWMSYEDFDEIYGQWSVNKYMDNAKFSYTMMTSKYTSQDLFHGRYKDNEFHFVQLEITERGMHTFAVSQYGERLLNRNSPYTYANVTAFIVKKDANESSTKNCTLVGHSYSRQDRDTYIEIKDMEPGTYFMYVDVDWQPLTHQELPKNKLQYSLNCYGVGDVKFGKNTAPELSQN